MKEWKCWASPHTLPGHVRDSGQVVELHSASSTGHRAAHVPAVVSTEPHTLLAKSPEEKGVRGDSGEEKESETWTQDSYRQGAAGTEGAIHA